MRKHADKICIYSQTNFIDLIMYSWGESGDTGWTWPNYLTLTQNCVINYVNYGLAKTRLGTARDRKHVPVIERLPTNKRQKKKALPSYIIYLIFHGYVLFSFCAAIASVVLVYETMASYLEKKS